MHQLRWQAKGLDAEESSFPRWRSYVNVRGAVSAANTSMIDDRKGLADGTTCNELSWTFIWASLSGGDYLAVAKLESSFWAIIECFLHFEDSVATYIVWLLIRSLYHDVISIFWYSSRQVFFFNRHKRHSSMFVIKLNITKVPLRAPLVGNVPKYSWSLWSLSVKFAFLFQILTIAASCSVCRLVDFPFALSQKEVLFSALPWLILSNYLNWSVKIKFNLAALLVVTHSVISSEVK